MTTKMFVINKTGWGHPVELGRMSVGDGREVVVAKFQNGTLKRTVRSYTPDRADEVLKGVTVHCKSHDRFPFEDKYGNKMWQTLYDNNVAF